MNRKPITLILFVFLLMLGLLPSCKKESRSDWELLLDPELTQWRTYLGFRHQDDYNGNVPVDSLGVPKIPVGYDKDPAHVFTTYQENGETILRVSGEIYGCIFTRESFDNYHLSLDVKWGEDKHVPRLKKLKDSGLVYHSIGEAGVDYWRSWMLGQEFQIMEGHMGDYWNVGTAAIDIRAFISEGQMNSVANERQPFIPFGTREPDGFCLRSENYETENGWTRIELICHEGRSLHIVNGNVVMVLRNSRYVEDGKVIPLTKGAIQLQSEAAEVFFKDVKIRKINSIPQEYTHLFN